VTGWCGSAAGVLMALVLAAAAAPADARPGSMATRTPHAGPVHPAAACNIGRRGYCDKYRGVCATHALGTRDCASWYTACQSCHDTADACSARTGSGTAQCARCSAGWSACMDRSYRNHWPLPHRYKNDLGPTT
jgi:hypothetical protein